MLASQTSHHFSHPVQEPFDAAVVIPTLCRPRLLRAARSVFRQRGVKRLQVLIGIDVLRGDSAVIEELLAARPASHAVTVLDLGYSTSVRHGGLNFAGDSGALRTILTYCANSRYVAYLDDDNWVDETHISGLLQAIQGQDWAYTLRVFVDPDALEPLAIDRWESVGPNRGVFAEACGGFVDPNCLMIDKLKCDDAIRLWAIPPPEEMRRMTADRLVFDRLRQHGAVGFTGAATTFYVLSGTDANRAHHLSWLRALRRDYGAAALTTDAPLPAYGHGLVGAPPAHSAARIHTFS